MRPSKQKTTLYIKHMVCDRCIRVVREELQKLGHSVRRVDLGEVDLDNTLTKKERDTIAAVLLSNGFELIENENARTIEAIKTAIIKLVHHNHTMEPMKMKYSEYISNVVGKEYHFLSTLFSSIESVTIEQYIIKQKIERVKELMKYGDHTLSEIAYMMNYSSVQHLSNQFKSVTGLTPSQFKNLSPKHSHHHRIPIDKV